MTNFYAGQVIIAGDRYHAASGTYTGGRPHLVMAEPENGQLYVVEWSHTPQGNWSTDELPSRHHDQSYLVTRHFRSGKWLGRWIDERQAQSYRRQLSAGARTEALQYVWGEYDRAHG